LHQQSLHQILILPAQLFPLGLENVWSQWPELQALQTSTLNELVVLWVKQHQFSQQPLPERHWSFQEFPQLSLQLPLLHGQCVVLRCLHEASPHA